MNAGNVVRVYMFEDSPIKRSYLPKLLNRLNQQFSSDHIIFEDGFVEAWSVVETNSAQLESSVWRAMADPDSICLIDLVLVSASDQKDYFKDATSRIYKSLDAAITHQAEQGEIEFGVSRDQAIHDRDAYRSMIEQLRASGAEGSQYSLSAMLLGLCTSRGRSAVLISTANASSATLLKMKFPDLLAAQFPERPNQDDLLSPVADLIAAHCRGRHALDFDAFLVSARKLTHKEIDTPCRDVESDAALLVRRLLRMDNLSFNREFVVDAMLCEALREALKSIAGLRDYVGLQCGWLIAFAMYRSLFPAKDWASVWSVDVFRNLQSGLAIPLLGPQKDTELRERSLRAFYHLCGALFKHQDHPSKSTLQSVSLSPQKLSFEVNFPFAAFRNAIYETGKDLHDRAQSLGTGVAQTSTARHGTSSLVTAFLVLRLLTDEDADVFDCNLVPLRITPAANGDTVLNYGS